MIKTFRSKSLAKLWDDGVGSKVDSRMAPRILIRLDALDAARVAQDLNQPGFDFHALKGAKPTRYTMHVNGPWCVTFEFENGDAYNLDFEQYH